jgi:hypothetical protein
MSCLVLVLSFLLITFLFTYYIINSDVSSGLPDGFYYSSLPPLFQFPAAHQVVNLYTWNLNILSLLWRGDDLTVLQSISLASDLFQMSSYRNLIMINTFSWLCNYIGMAPYSVMLVKNHKSIYFIPSRWGGLSNSDWILTTWNICWHQQTSDTFFPFLGNSFP